MAPTETLAEQHAATLDAAAREPVGPVRPADRRDARRAAPRGARQARVGELGMVVGTHALIEPDVEFGRLAVCVVDEQHRFGVRQRAALDAKGPEGRRPHALHMTATPIPRTLSLTAYGDLDATVLRELPAGRKPVDTWVVGEEKRAGAYGVHPRPACARAARPTSSARWSRTPREARGEGGGRGGRAAARRRSSRLRRRAPARPDGRRATSRRRWRRSRPGETDVLVATSVIEVGIDVAERDRDAGRGGRAIRPLAASPAARAGWAAASTRRNASCSPMPGSELARRRLEAIEEERDGFKLAEVDLALRGEGEILGTRQHGLPRFRVAELPDDVALLIEARREVIAMLDAGRIARGARARAAARRGPPALRRRAGRSRREEPGSLNAGGRR